MYVDEAKRRIQEALNVLDEPHVGNAVDRLQAALTDLGSPVVEIEWLQEKIESLVSQELGFRVAAAIPWTDLANADLIADLRTWIKHIVTAHQ